MSRWILKKLGELITLEYGKSLPESQRDSSGPYLVVGSNGIQGSHTQALVKAPGVVVGRKGSVGQVNMYDQDFWPIDTTYYVVPKVDLSIKWIHYGLKTLPLANLATATGVPGLNRNDVYALSILFPPVTEQERIVGILDEADQLRRLRAEADRRTTHLIPALFHEMFGSMSAAGKNCKQVHLEEVTTRITDGVHLKPNYTPSGVPFISVKDITTGKLKFDDCKFVSREDHKRFTKRCKPEYLDILYTKVGATYGRPALVDTDKEFSIYVSVCLIKPNKNLIEPQFLNAVMGTAAVKKQADQTIKGIGVPDLHLDQIKNFVIPLPPLAIQRKFSAYVAEIKAYEAVQSASRPQLDCLFLSLHHRAFRGEL